MDKMTIGNRIRYERIKRGLTLEELGDKVGVSKQCLSSWEHGRNMPDVISLSIIADVCNLEIKDFLRSHASKQHAPVPPNNSSENFTDKEKQIINKLRTMNADKRKAFEVLLGVRDKGNIINKT